MAHLQYKKIEKVGSPSSKRRLVYFIGTVALLVILAGVLEMTNTTHFFHKQSHVLDVNNNTPTTGGASQNNQKGQPQGSSSDNSGDALQPGDAKSDAGGVITGNLLTPAGDFVSNHHPSLSNTSTAPNVLTSVCNTSPGATCVITFTKGTVTKSLAVEITDRGGSAYWNNWSLQSIGLTAGNWKVIATATLKGQSKSATDEMALVVAP